MKEVVENNLEDHQNMVKKNKTVDIVKAYFNSKSIKTEEFLDRMSTYSPKPVVYLDDACSYPTLNIQLEEAYQYCHDNGYENIEICCDNVLNDDEYAPTYKYDYYRKKIIPSLAVGSIEHIIFYSITAIPQPICELLCLAVFNGIKIDFIHFDDEIDYTCDEEEILQYYLECQK